MFFNWYKDREHPVFEGRVYGSKKNDKKFNGADNDKFF